LHLSGDLVESNSTLAAEMFHKAADMGLPPAQEAWGSECDRRLTNQVEAAVWYYRAATQGLVRAQSSLSVLNREPSSWRFDPQFQPKACEKARWTFENASQPVACFTTYFACNDMGDLYLSGLGVESNAVEAVRWYRRAIGTGVAYGGGEYNLALCYFGGDGVPQDDTEGLKWLERANKKGYKGDASWEFQIVASALRRDDSHTALRYTRKLAAQGVGLAEFILGGAYADGVGVAKDQSEAIKWFRKAAEQGEPTAQFYLGVIYAAGNGVPQDYAEALKLYRKSGNQGIANAQNNLGVMYAKGQGVPQDYVEAYKWYNLAAAQGDSTAINNRDGIVQFMTASQIAEGQRLARDFKPSKAPASGESTSSDNITDSRPSGSGTGFFITEDGFVVTGEHVVKDATHIRLVTSTGLISAKVVKVDAANDLALLKAGIIHAPPPGFVLAQGVVTEFSPLPIASSRAVKMGSTVATVGFPNIGLQGFAPKLAKGEIAALSGAQDDPRYFQISVPVQPGNSGGALVDERGNVVGVVAAKLNVAAALATSGALPENVNYAVKSSFLLSFLESVPEVAAKLKEPNTKDRKFEDVVQSTKQAAVLVLVY
jgi:TPR repeat protein